MTEVKLKPCPFCGAKCSAEKFTKNTVQLMEGVKCFWVICLNCGVRTGEYYKSDDAVTIWNRRIDNVSKKNRY